MCWGVWLEYKLTRNVTYGSQQQLWLLWQKQVTVLGSIDLDFRVDEHHTGVAQLRRAVSRRRSMLLL